MGQTITVKDGDSILSIAHANQIWDWRFIWDDPANEELRKARPDPNILAPGDRIYLPDPRPKVEACQTDQIHKFQIKRLTALVDIVLRNEYGYVLAGVPYELEVKGEKHTGMTDEQGRLNVRTSPDAKTGKLTIYPDPKDKRNNFSWTLQIGYMNPVLDTEGKPTGDLTGIQARLNNLGFDAGTPDGQMNEQTRAAIKEFQEYIEMEEPTGELDDETRTLLELLHNAI